MEIVCRNINVFEETMADPRKVKLNLLKEIVKNILSWSLQLTRTKKKDLSKNKTEVKNFVLKWKCIIKHQ